MSDVGPPTSKLGLLTADEFMAYIQAHRSVPQYDPSQETKGSHPFWALPRSRIDSILDNMHATLAKILVGIPKGDRELGHLHKSVHHISQVKCSSGLTIGLVGLQGAGKSLFLSALFDKEYISWNAANGEACTRTAIKYAYIATNATSDNSDLFFAEVKFLDDKKLEEMLRELIRDIKHYEDDEDDPDDEEAQGAQTYDKDEDDKRRFETAKEIFTVLFGSEKTFFDCLTSRSTDEFVQLCKLRARETMKKCGVPEGGDTCTRSAKNHRGLMHKIRHFLAEVEGEDCFWPLIDHVTIRFDHELLKYGAIFIDVPGSGDTNISRARHIERIKDTADIVIVFADTIRVATDDRAFDAVQSCSISRGREKVMFVATKIDALLPNDLNNCEGAAYDHIRRMIGDATEKVKALEDDDSLMEAMQMGNYATYLERQLLLQYSTTRAAGISVKLAQKLGCRNATDMVKDFHISAANYLGWQAKPMISFRLQPPLPPMNTNIPAIRQYLFGLLAPRNYNDMTYHLHSFLPNYLQKVERVLYESDRNADFESLAIEFDQRMNELIDDNLSQAKKVFQRILKDTLARICTSTAPYQKQVDTKCNELCKFYAPTFNKILRNKGTLLPKASKAKGLENGCSYNRDFANIIAPAIQRWAANYATRMAPMPRSLIEFSALMGQAILSMLNQSPAAVMVVERAKNLWKPYRLDLQAKTKVLIMAFEKMQKNLILTATMEDGRETSLVATITDQHFDAALDAEPAQIPNASGKKKKQEPKVRAQKRTLLESFSNPNDHFVDDVFKKFREEASKNVDNLLDDHFRQIREHMRQYSASLKEQAPITYKVEQGGLDIRAEIAKIFPEIQNMVADLQRLVPDQRAAQDDAAIYLPDLDGPKTLVEIYDQVSRKRKQGDQDSGRAKVKKEDV